MSSPLRSLLRSRPMTQRRWLLIAGAVALPSLYTILFSSHGLMKRMELESDADAMRSEIVRLRSTGDSMRAEMRLLRTDPVTVERIAREQYGMARAGETVYLVEEE